MVIIESLKRNVSRITIFIGDLPPLFFIVYVIYFNTPYSIYTLVVLAVSIAMAFYWKVILNLADDSKDKADGYILIRVAGINYEPRGLVTV